jgi:1-acyl-sn-glycerol-3-phosphate acyltransferase
MQERRGADHPSTADGFDPRRGRWRYAAEGFDPLRTCLRALERLATAALNWIVTKPIAVHVWWLSSRANTTDFRERPELRARIGAARSAGRPVLFASNHLSMFDDPVVPMALYRTGPRAARDLLVLGGLVLAASLLPAGALASAAIAGAVAWALGAGLWGAGKDWWSLGDLVNFSGADALRGKLEIRSGRPPGKLASALLALADPTIYYFMRSGAVKTVFVDRRPGEEPKRARARAVEETVDITARAEPVWIFFEGGRAVVPGEIGPARRGIGDVVIGLRARGLEPLVVAVHHRGLELVIPRGSSRWIVPGHRIEVCWSELALPRSEDAQALADAAREEVVRLADLGGGRA